MTRYVQEEYAYSGDARKKDYYDLVFDLIQQNCYETVLDVGCASGDFLSLLPFSNLRGIGIDISKELIEKANESNQLKNISFECVDLVHDKPFKTKSFDLVTIFGTLSTIEDHISFLDAVFDLEPKTIVINDFFNEKDIDICCGYKIPNGVNSDYNFSYIVRSIKTIETYLLSKPKYDFKFQPYELNTILKPTDNPMRNYHAELNGRKVITNGMNLVLYGYNLFITQK